MCDSLLCGTFDGYFSQSFQFSFTEQFLSALHAYRHQFGVAAQVIGVDTA